MPDIDANMLSETLDVVLQQQFMSDSGKLLNRTKREEVDIPGMKFTMIRLKKAIMAGLQLVLGGRIDKFIDFLADKFQVPKDLFESRLSLLGEQYHAMDTRMKFMMIISVLREHWQDAAYNKVVDEVLRLVVKNWDGDLPNRDKVHEILSSRCGPDFSMAVNISILAEMSRLVGTPLKAQDSWLDVMDRLVAATMAALDAP